MARTKPQVTVRGVPYNELLDQPPPPQPRSQTPKRGLPYVPEHVLNPILLIVLNLAIQSTLVALAVQYVGEEFKTVYADTPEGYWWHIVQTWKWLIKPLGIWYGGFGATETSILSFLALVPTTHFIFTFHPSFSPLAHASTIAISSASLTLPIYLLRSRVEEKHHHRKHHRAGRVDSSTYISTGMLASSIYASVMYTSLKTFLTGLIVTYFVSLAPPESKSESEILVQSVERVYKPTAESWGIAVPVGFAVAELVFRKAIKEHKIAAAEARKRIEGGEVEGEEELRKKGLLVRMWDWFAPLGKTIIKRTLWVAGYMGTDSVVRLGGVINGGSLEGAAIVGGVWVGATLLVGLVFGWIGKE